MFISAYIEDQFHISPSKTMTIGLRRDYNQYTGWEKSYNLGMSSVINSDNTIWAAYSSTKVIPNRLDTIENATLGWQQQSVDPSMPTLTKVVLTNNQNYHSQALDSMELGLRTKWSGGLSSDVVFFYQKFQDLKSYKFKEFGLSSLPDYLTYYMENDNSGKVVMNGLEMSTNWIISGEWQAKSSFTFNHPISEEGDTAAYELLIPKFYTSLGLFWTPSSNFNINGFVHYHSDSIETTSPTIALRQYSYTTVDVNTRWRLSNDLEFSVIGNNLMNDCPGQDSLMVDSGSYSIRVCEARSLVGQLRWNF
jgi:outer membrane receptor for ferrienterochelin and colicin